MHDPQNLADLVGIAVSLRNKYGITPFHAAAQGYPIPNALTVRYFLEGITVNKIVNIVLDIPGLSALTIIPRGIPRNSRWRLRLAANLVWNRLIPLLASEPSYFNKYSRKNCTVA
jgi:hypothetical protein